MANEAQVRNSLIIRKGTLRYRTPTTSFSATVNAAKGPSPGGILVPAGGRIISLSELGTPGLCEMKNNDSVNPVSWGIYDADTDRFFPIGKILPGENYIIRLHPDLASEFVGTGTGTVASSGTLFFHASIPVWVEVNAFAN